MNDMLEFLKDSLKQELRLIECCLENGYDELLSSHYLPKLVHLAKMMDTIRSLPGGKDDIAL